MTNYMMRLLALTFGAILTLQTTAMAQSLFDPVITVNNDAITRYELDQRKRLLEVFRTPGDIDKAARDGLIEDRLKLQELDRVGLRLNDDALLAAMEEFSGRANLTLDQFLAVLASNGVEETTLADFVKVGITWRDLIRGKFNQRVDVTDAEVDRLISQGAGGADHIEILLSEIIIPAPPQQAAQAMATAQSISNIRSLAGFSAQARRVSALPSKNNGGRLGWLPLSNYPAALHNLFLGLEVGEVTDPLPITNGVALFQLRGIREVAQKSSPPVSIEYAQLAAASLEDARDIAAQVDTCDDLYGVAFGQDDNVLLRDTQNLSDIPTNIAIELARLDRDELSFNLPTADGAGRIVLMLCQRNAVTDGGVDREALRNTIRSQRLSGYADALLADLRASASIRTQ